MESFGIIGNEFVNLYSKDNPLLGPNDSCYFIFNNMVDYHRPLLAKGIIVDDKFTDGLNKSYFIRITEIFESPKVMSTFLYGKQFEIYPYEEGILRGKKLIQIGPGFNFNQAAFKIEAFFVRKSEEKIKELHSEYIEVLRKDIIKQLKDIEAISYDTF